MNPLAMAERSVLDLMESRHLETDVYIALLEIEWWDMTGIEAAVLDGKRMDPAVVPAATYAYRCFLALHVLTDASVLMDNALVEAVWRTHSLDATDYAELCGRIGKFIHRPPLLPSPDAERESFSALYGRYYGPLPLSLLDDSMSEAGRTEIGGVTVVEMEPSWWFYCMKGFRPWARRAATAPTARNTGRSISGRDRASTADEAFADSATSGRRG